MKQGVVSPNLCFFKDHLVAVWENTATSEVKDGRALGSESENGDKGDLSERYSFRKLIKSFRKLH